MGNAFLPDGTMIDYDEYIKSHPHWQVVRNARLRFDGGRCVVCHKEVTGGRFETHHLSYQHLGNEHMTDVITLCPAHHTMFHNNWRKQDFWKGREQNHWEAFNLEHTARMCADIYKQDKFICCDANAPNLCYQDTIRQYIDDYAKSCGLIPPPIIDANDISLFVRNKRYELVFDAESRGLSVEDFLNERYGEKVRGKNPLRQEAGKKNGTFDHDMKSFHRHYKENKNLNILMEEAKKYYQEE